MFLTWVTPSKVSSNPPHTSILNTAGMDFPVNNISINVNGIEPRIENKNITYEIVGYFRYAEKKIHYNLLYI